MDKKKPHLPVSVPEGAAAPDDVRVLFGARPCGIDSRGTIAAIGNNAGGSGSHAYVIGFGLAASLLLKSLNREVSVGNEVEYLPEDALIHPTAFCARHFVELFLKDIPADLHKLRNTPFKAQDHHDIEKLWGAFEAACLLDERTREFPEKLRDVVIAIARLDPTGQTFRYRTDRNDETHLDDLAIIHVPDFADSFSKIFEAVRELYAVIEGLEFEYVLGTYTAKLSRKDLQEVAKRIGAAAASGKEALRKAQAEICAQYSLSRQEYQRARDKIESNYLLSMVAGKERPLVDLDAAALGRVITAITGDDAEPDLRPSDFGAAWGVLCAGDVMGAAEDYDYQLKAFLEGNLPTGSADVLRALRSKPTKLRKGLVRLGQNSLLAQLDAIFPGDELKKVEERRFKERWSGRG
jgi:hypothetical protein